LKENLKQQPVYFLTAFNTFFFLNVIYFIIIFFIIIIITEKPNWKEFKKEKQELRLKRKQQKRPFFETVQKAKQPWEKARRGNCPKDEKKTLLTKLFKFSKSHLETVCFFYSITNAIITFCIYFWFNHLDGLLARYCPYSPMDVETRNT